MKKRLLLSLTALVALSASAQQKFEESIEIGTPQTIKMKKQTSEQKSASISGDDSYYYWENNNRYTSELNAYLNDTPPSEGGTGFDSLGLYSYKVKEKTASVPYWQTLIQGIPLQATATLNEIVFLGQGLGTSGSNVQVDVYDKNLSNILSTETVWLSNVYSFKSVTFSTPAVSNDTVLVVFSMPTVADSFTVAYSHNYFNGVDLLQSGTAFQTALPFQGDAAIFAVQPANAAVLGLIRDNFDFFIIPNFSYDVTASFNTSNLTICEGEDVTFTNTGDTSHLYNPVLNYIAWDFLANGNAPAYTIFDYEGTSTNDYQSSQIVTNTYATSGSFTASAGIMTFPWSASSLVIDAQNFTVDVAAKTTTTFTAISAFCSGATAPTLEASSIETIPGTWSPSTIDNTTVGTATYTFTPANGECAANATLDVTVNDCASLEANNAANFTVFPNPANDVVTVSLTNVTEGTIRLLSAEGKVIESKEVSSSVVSFNVKSLNAGVYFIQVGQTIEKLMVK